VLEAFDAADRVIVVTAPEIPAIKNTRIGLDMMDLVGYPREQRRILLNQADPSLGLTSADVEGALQCEIALELPSDRAVPLSVNNGVPLVAAKPTHPVSRALRNFAVREIFGANPLAPAAGARPRWRRRSA
jgi:pilus assembly protein CpaE